MTRVLSSLVIILLYDDCNDREVIIVLMVSA